MAIEKIGINISALNNITAPNISIPTTGKQLIENLPILANSHALGYYAYAMLGGLLILFYYLLSDKSPLADFRYSDIRAFSLASGLVAFLGWTMISVGYVESLRAVIVVSVIFIITNVYLIAVDNKT